MKQVADAQLSARIKYMGSGEGRERRQLPLFFRKRSRSFALGVAKRVKSEDWDWEETLSVDGGKRARRKIRDCLYLTF